MKKSFLLIIFAICVFTTTFAQSPFKYQAVIRDNSGNILTNKNVGLRIAIMQGTSPAMVYREEFNKTSDQFGIINVEVGMGSVLNGNYLTINWGTLNNQLQVEIDMNGGTTYTMLGTSPILSAPIANYAANGVPVGSIMPFAGTTPPAGWLLCDGSAISRTNYSTLFAAISINWGAGDLTTTFNLPDLRGQFLRGMDGTAGIDPDKNSRTAKYSGGNTGNNVGSYQVDAFQGHFHAITGSGAAAYYPGADDALGGTYATRTSGSQVYISNPTSDGSNGTPRTSSETRSKNANVLYIIKY